MWIAKKREMIYSRPLRRPRRRSRNTFTAGNGYRPEGDPGTWEDLGDRTLVRVPGTGGRHVVSARPGNWQARRCEAGQGPSISYMEGPCLFCPTSAPAEAAGKPGLRPQRSQIPAAGPGQAGDRLHAKSTSARTAAARSWHGSRCAGGQARAGCPNARPCGTRGTAVAARRLGPGTACRLLWQTCGSLVQNATEAVCTLGKVPWIARQAAVVTASPPGRSRINSLCKEVNR